MQKEELLKELYTQDEIGKEIILEKLIFCHFSDEQNFENYFKIEELGERELFCLIGLLYHQDCFFMISDIINRHESRFLSHRDSLLKEIDFSERFHSRLSRLNSITKN